MAISEKFSCENLDYLFTGSELDWFQTSYAIQKILALQCQAVTWEFAWYVTVNNDLLPDLGTGIVTNFNPDSLILNKKIILLSTLPEMVV